MRCMTFIVMLALFAGLAIADRENQLPSADLQAPRLLGPGEPEEPEVVN